MQLPRALEHTCACGCSGIGIGVEPLRGDPQARSSAVEHVYSVRMSIALCRFLFSGVAPTPPPVPLSTPGREGSLVEQKGSIHTSHQF